MYACLAVWAVTHFLIQRLPAAEAIDKALYADPKQISIPQQKFTITYKGKTTSVVAQADYELWGVVISHNDPGKWYTFDISHDAYSIDTRDLCVMWGKNIQDDTYRNMSFHSDDWMCWVKYGARDRVNYFNMEQLSNNHLITDKDAVRRTIAGVQLGDQIHIKGKLVNYSEDRSGGFWRNSSLTRSDTGNGACEVIFVESIEVLHSQNALWALLGQISKYVFAALALLRIVLFFR